MNERMIGCRSGPALESGILAQVVAAVGTGGLEHRAQHPVGAGQRADLGRPAGSEMPTVRKLAEAALVVGDAERGVAGAAEVAGGVDQCAAARPGRCARPAIASTASETARNEVGRRAAMAPERYVRRGRRTRPMVPSRIATAVAATRSGRQQLRRPGAVRGAGVAPPVVQAVIAVLPELDRDRHQQVSAQCGGRGTSPSPKRAAPPRSGPSAPRATRSAGSGRWPTRPAGSHRAGWRSTRRTRRLPAARRGLRSAPAGPAAASGTPAPHAGSPAARRLAAVGGWCRSGTRAGRRRAAAPSAPTARPSADAVASVIASGWSMPRASAAASHSRNSAIGSLSVTPRIVAQVTVSFATMPSWRWPGSEQNRL